MNRRGFLGSILAAAAAPAIIKSGVLMPLHVARGELVQVHEWLVEAYTEADLKRDLEKIWHLEPAESPFFATQKWEVIGDGMILTGAVQIYPSGWTA